MTTQKGAILKKKVLLIEDENDIQELMSLQLQLQNLDVIAIDNGEEAIDLIQNEQFDLFIIDRMLPGVSGTEIVKFIRRFHLTKYLPILIVTALSRNEDIVEGLEAGADDYITKPFDLKVFEARTDALLRRSHYFKETISKTYRRESPIRTLGKISINTETYEVQSEGKQIPLTISEYKILLHLSENPKKVLTRKEMMTLVQGQEVHVTERTIDTHISGLRKKLQESSHLIETIRGIGYRINDET